MTLIVSYGTPALLLPAPSAAAAVALFKLPQDAILTLAAVAVVQVTKPLLHHYCQSQLPGKKKKKCIFWSITLKRNKSRLMRGSSHIQSVLIGVEY